MSNISLQDQVIEWLSGQSIIEILAALVKDPGRPSGAFPPPLRLPPLASASLPAAPAAAAEEKSRVQPSPSMAGGENKIGAITEVRAITGLGLKEAKDLVEGAPKAGSAKAPTRPGRAEEIVLKKLEAAGARWSLQVSAWRLPACHHRFRQSTDRQAVLVPSTACPFGFVLLSLLAPQDLRSGCSHCRWVRH